MSDTAAGELKYEGFLVAVLQYVRLRKIHELFAIPLRAQPKYQGRLERAGGSAGGRFRGPRAWENEPLFWQRQMRATWRPHHPKAGATWGGASLHRPPPLPRR